MVTRITHPIELWPLVSSSVYAGRCSVLVAPLLMHWFYQLLVDEGWLPWMLQLSVWWNVRMPPILPSFTRFLSIDHSRPSLLYPKFSVVASNFSHHLCLSVTPFITLVASRCPSDILYCLPTFHISTRGPMGNPTRTSVHMCGISKAVGITLVELSSL